MSDGSATRRAIVAHEADNVATLVDNRLDAVRLAGGGPVAPGLSFGHKVALRDIAEGEAVVKYGVAIGRATRPVARGEHVHVHNCG